MAEPITLNRAQSREVDRIAIDELGIPGVVLMENAAAALEREALSLLADRPAGAAVVVLAGPGNNGGDGFALARRLAVAGRSVEILAVRGVEDHAGDALTNARIAHRMGLRIRVVGEAPAEDRPDAALIVDALLGTGATRAPEGVIPALVGWANRHGEMGIPVLAVDIPTGLDADTGAPLGDERAVVRADRTVTLGSMKTGLAVVGATPYAGAVVVGEIGVPPGVLVRARDSAP